MDKTPLGMIITGKHHGLNRSSNSWGETWLFLTHHWRKSCAFQETVCFYTWTLFISRRNPHGSQIELLRSCNSNHAGRQSSNLLAVVCLLKHRSSQCCKLGGQSTWGSLSSAIHALMFPDSEAMSQVDITETIQPSSEAHRWTSVRIRRNSITRRARSTCIFSQLYDAYIYGDL